MGIVRDSAMIPRPSAYMPKTTDPEQSNPSVKGGVVTRVSGAILGLVATIPTSIEPKSDAPADRAGQLSETAARTTAKISGLAALAPGPLGLLTLLPDLIAMWKIQSQLVADVAATYGKTATLGKEQMLWCLFKHSAAQTFRDVVYRAGERYLVRPVSLRVLQKITTAVGIKISQRALGKAVARYLPLVGAAAVGGYAYYDTKKVGSAAIELFSHEIVVATDSGLIIDVGGSDA